MNRVHNEIFVISDTEQYDNEYMLQLLTKARAIADIAGKRVVLVVAGETDTQRIKRVSQYGADKIIICEQYPENDSKEFSNILSEVLTKYLPEVVLFPATCIGKAVAATLSTRFEAGLVAECIDIEVSTDGDFIFSRAAMNDLVIAKIQCINCAMKMCTIKRNTFNKKFRKDVCQSEILKFGRCFSQKEENIKILDLIRPEKKQTDISQYSTVFCIGRGVKEVSLRNRIINLAERCNASIVGTRPVVEEGILSRERQVGQSGRNISPKVYIGFGVSGASQHMVGIMNAQTIIAINNDKDAAIFNYADYIIIEDIAAVIEEMEKLLDQYNEQ